MHDMGLSRGRKRAFPRGGSFYERFLGPKGLRFKGLLISDVGAVEQNIDGKKALCAPGSKGITDLRRVLAL
jgi:hypothetical protein